jgi:hypothetical protein
LARIQMHSFSEKLKPAMPPFLFSVVAIASLLYKCGILYW